MSRKKIILAILFLLLVFVIGLRYCSNLPKLNDKERVRISSRANTEPIRYETSQYLKIDNIKIYLPIYPEISYGDYFVVEGVFDEKTNSLKEVKLIEHHPSKGYVYKLRQSLVNFYKKALPEPHASLVAGVAIGSKAEIPAYFWQMMKKSGTAHIMVASGFNVTLVAGFLVSLFILFLPRKKAVVLALAGIWLYAIIAGFDAPIVRAAIMGSIAFLAVGLGRINYAWRALFVSVVIMLIIWPLWLIDLGFILSFAATSSLMFFGNFFKRMVSILRVPSVIGEGLYTSLAAQIFVAPILFVTFGYLSIWSPLVNALILWTIPLITTIGIIAGLIGIFWFDFGRLILLCIYPLTSLVVLIVGRV